MLLLRLDLTLLPLSFTPYPPCAVAPPLSYLSHASSLYPKSSPLTVPSWFTSPSQGYIIKIGRDVGLIHPHLHFQDIAMLPLDIQQLVCKFKQFCLLHKTLHDILLVFSSHLQHFSWSIRWWTLLIPFINSFHQYCHNSLKIYTTHHGANINKHIFNDTSVLDCCIWHNPNPTEHVFRQKVKFLNPAKCFIVQVKPSQRFAFPKSGDKPDQLSSWRLFNVFEAFTDWDLGHEAWLGSLEARHAAPFLRAVPGSNDVKYCKCVILWYFHVQKFVCLDVK